MGWMFAMGAVLAHSAPAEQASTPADDPFCQDIRAIFDHRANGFAELRGAFLTDEEAWVGTTILPGAQSCHVVEGSYTRYRCTWAITDGAGAAAAQAKSIAETARWCFSQGTPRGSGWSMNDQPSGETLFDANIQFPSARATIIVRAFQGRRKSYITFAVEDRS